MVIRQQPQRLREKAAVELLADVEQHRVIEVAEIVHDGMRRRAVRAVLQEPVQDRSQLDRTGQRLLLGGFDARTRSLGNSRELLDGLAVEEMARREAESLAVGATDDLDRGDRVTAEIEEVVANADSADVQQLTPDPGEALLAGIARSNEGRSDSLTAAIRRSRQCGPVDLAIRCQGDLIEMDVSRRVHEARQRARHVFGERSLCDLLGGNVVRDESRLGGRRRWDVVADVGEDLPDLVDIDLVVELLEGGLANLVSHAYVPAVGQGIVVVAALSGVHVDADVVDPAVGRASGVGGANPRNPLVQVVEHLVETDRAVAVEIEHSDVFEDAIVAKGGGIERA